MANHRFDPAKVYKLDNPERRKAFPPKKILSLLQIKQDDVVLDLGAGPGYFTLPAASLTTGKVIALDAEPKMLEILKQKTDQHSLNNVELVKGTIEDIPLENNQVDRIIASLVLHEVDALSRAIQEIYRVLKPGGYLLCLEWEKKAAEQEPPRRPRIHSDKMKKILEENGFQLLQFSFPTKQHYMMIAQKK
ncbi:MAG: class I SAM-dependent methyltransferase [Thermoactinomyces sp.]